MPMYIKYMGDESYGLVGFYIMLQAWMQLLDLGMTPTLIRETARYRGGESSQLELKKLIRTLETIFYGITLSAVFLSYLFSDSVAINWLKVEHLPLDIVGTSIQLTAIAVVLRWVSSLYRGIVTGFEEIVWLSTYNIFIALSRFIFVIPIILWVDNGPVSFFGYQLLISLTEVLLLRLKAYSLYASKVGKKSNISFFHWESLKGVLRFSGTIAFTASTWAIVTQADKLILSKILTLTDYAYFTLAIMASSGIAVLGNTSGIALMPRFSKLSAENKNNEILLLYRTSTKFIGAVTIPASLALAFFAQPILFIWTGDNEIASKTAKVLSLYSIGNCFLVFNAFPYYLQYAYGNLRLHLIGSILFVLFFLPTLIYYSGQYGAVGASWSWMLANFICFIFWVAFLHKQLSPGLHLKWLFNDVGFSLICCLPFAIALNYFISWPFHRLQAFFVLLIVCVVLILSTLVPTLLTQHFIKIADLVRIYEKYTTR